MANLRSLLKAIPIAAAAGTGVALLPDEAEAMNIGATALKFAQTPGKFVLKHDKGVRATIPETNAKLIRMPVANEKTTYGDVLHYPEFYENYPMARNLKLYANTVGTPAYHPGTTGEGGSAERVMTNIYNPIGKVNKSGKQIPGTNEERYLDDLQHELQHWTQNKEGWGPGGQPRSGLNEGKNYKEYYNIPGEAEARWRGIGARPNNLDTPSPVVDAGLVPVKRFVGRSAATELQRDYQLSNVINEQINKFRDYLHPNKNIARSVVDMGGAPDEKPLEDAWNPVEEAAMALPTGGMRILPKVAQFAMGAAIEPTANFLRSKIEASQINKQKRDEN